MEGQTRDLQLFPVGSSELMSIKTLHCEKFETIQKAIQFYLSSIEDIQVNSACIASAGTVHLDTFKPANNDWVINTDLKFHQHAKQYSGELD